ncbi:HdeD family acid-resistance protein [Tropicimonas marinistellae]|uniref:HdeD family acid-resistance protein n=1 Tax=Tropicimonas marinistellae TaxID=1739787 RepID=UPI000831DA35|nr:DUF308 domain-containing protein [Tropicimonas marinistellae]
MSEWARWLLLGVLSVTFGSFALANAYGASQAVTLVTGSLLIVAGVIQVGVGIHDTGAANKLISVILGLLVTTLGLLLLRNPFQGMRSLALLVTVFIGAAGVLRLVWALRMRNTKYYWTMLISGALSVLLAGYIFSSFDQTSKRLLGTLLGIEMIFNGVALVALALFLRANRDET